MNSGIEHAALMVSEEKTQHDSRKNFKNELQTASKIPTYVLNFKLLFVVQIARSIKNKKYQQKKKNTNKINTKMNLKNKHQYQWK